MTSKILSIAGFNIELCSDNGHEIGIEPGIKPFLSETPSGSSDVLVHSFTSIPDTFSDDENLLFEAKDGLKKYFSIYRSDDSLKFKIYDRKSPGHIQQVAFLSEDFSTWKVYSRPDGSDGTVNPLKYPLGPLIYYYLTVNHNAILIHASGVSNQRTGLLFTGSSGAGKSTMARLWQRAGYHLINDDRIIIRKVAGNFIMYNTPMMYPASPASSILSSICLIKHAPENISNRLTGVNAVSRIMANCIQHGYSARIIDHHLQFLIGLCCNIQVFDVGFVPDARIVDFLTHDG